MKLSLSDPTTAHKKFAWKPVVVIDRASNTIYIAWLEFVMRRLVSVSGALVWAYAPLPSAFPSASS